MTGSLFVFSGIDGAGKSTQIERLASRLRRHGLRTVTLWSRGGYTPGMTALKAWARRLLHPGIIPPPGHSARRAAAFSRRTTRQLWLALAVADLLWLYGLGVRLLRSLGYVVICDRYWQDTMLDFHAHFPQENVPAWGLWKLLRRWAPQPNASFLILIPLDEALARSQQKHEPFPSAARELVLRLRAYEAWQHSPQWHVLDGLRPVDELARDTFAVVSRVTAQRAAVTPARL
jgi:dTMP kinase